MAAKDKQDDSKELARFLSKLNPDNFDQTVLNDSWLNSRSKAQLARTVKVLAGRLKGETTLKVDRADLPAASTIVPSTLPGPKHITEELRLPASPKAGKEDGQWEITLVSKKSGARPLRVTVLDDFTIGRKSGSNPADLDLIPYGADKLGVSRQHAAMRVSPDGLYLVDLGSTNGTYYRGKQLKLGEPIKISERAAIAFGSLVLSVAKIKKLR